MAEVFLSIEDLTVTLSGSKVLNNINLCIKPGEQWAIVGASGSGKTVLAHTLAGKHFYTGNVAFDTGSAQKPHIVVVDQQHRFKNLSNTSDFYYQQRYNASESEDAVTVEMALQQLQPTNKNTVAGIRLDALPSLLHIEHLLQKPLIQLSNGENKRLQIAKAILQEPELLILDNPFLGLDTDGRKILNNIIDLLIRSGVKILLITSATELPESITHIGILEKGALINTLQKKDFSPADFYSHSSFRVDENLLHSLKKTTDDFEYAVRMVDTQVIYGERKILDSINWSVKKGECWSISGPNGAGKSTLLSLITGDNAKAYSNEIYLFDKRRGTGESIWDIKKKIGYVSPEMHVYFDYTATCFETIASGLFDSIGLFRQLTDEHRKQVKSWLYLLQLEDMQHKLLSQLSAGEQRLVLLARALVKNPPMLILDEPCQGLDKAHVQKFMHIVNDICHTFGTTLLYVSHYKEEIPSCVTKFLQIENGSATITM
ncbi:MAG: ATP-binding cassette domain-containing protein [Agriterribacter sp.]